jgi:hypothetical protein
MTRGSLDDGDGDGDGDGDDEEELWSDAWYTRL